MVWILNGWKTSPSHEGFLSDLEHSLCFAVPWLPVMLRSDRIKRNNLIQGMFIRVLVLIYLEMLIGRDNDVWALETLAVPRDVQLILKSCGTFGENPDGFGDNPDIFVRIPTTLVKIPACLWFSSLRTGGSAFVWGAGKDPGITISVEHSGNCVRIQLQPRTGHTHRDPGEGPGRLVQLNCCHLNKHQPQRQWFSAWSK